MLTSLGGRLEVSDGRGKLGAAPVRVEGSSNVHVHRIKEAMGPVR